MQVLHYTFLHDTVRIMGFLVDVGAYDRHGSFGAWILKLTRSF